MLIIRPEQWRALEASRERDLRERACAHLTEVHRARAIALGAAALDRLAADGIADARRRGAIVERALFDYLECALVFGREFAWAPEHGWARRVLEDSRLSACEQMARLRDHARRHAGLA